MKTLQVAVAPGPSTIVYHSMRRPLPVQELVLACAVQNICWRLGGEITVDDVSAAVRPQKTLLGFLDSCRGSKVRLNRRCIAGFFGYQCFIEIVFS